ncbi:MAG: ABC-type transport auxiliary lipoprotein family protein [Pseudohongiella sp.]|nr:ABC-type transport auxiliary lipoprotein family protein [Pseudohongiella sp.]
MSYVLHRGKSGRAMLFLRGLLVLVLMAACTVLPEREPVDLFQLPPSAIRAHSSPQLTGGLRLMIPESSDALGGSRLLILTENNNFQAYPGARWTAPIPQLWRDWLLDAFWQDGRFASLSTDSAGLQSELSLNGMLRALHTETINGRATAVVRFDALLISSARREIVASKRFETRESLSSNTAAASVAALGVAADRLAIELISWAAANTDN